MNKKFFVATLCTLLTASAQANTVGLYLGGQIWQSKTSGMFGNKSMPNNYDFKKEQQINFSVAFEHPLPFLPHIRISNTTLDVKDKASLTQEYSADNETAHVDVYAELDISANFNVNYVDYTLYYELFDNDIFSFDLGLSARDFSGSISVIEDADTITSTRDYIWDGEEHIDHDYHTVTETAQTITIDKLKTNEIEPMLYVATNIGLPLAGLSVIAQGDFALASDHSIYDYQVGLSYELVHNRMIDFNLTLGYRTVNLEFEDEKNLYADLKFKGVFVGMGAHF